MISINRHEVDELSKQFNSKKTLGKKDNFLYPIFSHSQTKDSLLIAPCSSKKYGKGYPEIVDATTNDGFSGNTSIQTNSIRWISKNRVIANLGNTTPNILNQIDALLLKIITLHTKYMLEKDNIIANLESENTLLKDNLQELQTRLNTITDISDSPDYFPNPIDNMPPS